MYLLNILYYNIREVRHLLFFLSFPRLYLLYSHYFTYKKLTVLTCKKVIPDMDFLQFSHIF